MDFNIKSAGVSTNVQSWQDIESYFKGQGAITLKFSVGVLNKNWFNIPIRDLETRVFYQGQLIGNSSSTSPKNIDIYSGSYKEWIEAVDIHAKGNFVKQFVQEIFSGGDPVIEYQTELKVLGIRYTYSERIKVIETTLSELS